MKVLTITGTRPELIRLSIILKKLDEVCTHIHVYTNQNYDPNLSAVFVKELRIRTPNYTFMNTHSIGEFFANGFQTLETILDVECPDKVLVLGDTNSGLLAILAAKKGIPVYHMEAGNRCYDDTVPEEMNRRVLDVCAYINMPYTENSKQNLIKEGFHKNFVFKIGNPIKEVLDHYDQEISGSGILAKLKQGGSSFALLTYHRTENTDNKVVASNIIEAVNFIAEELPVVFPMHPRTKDLLDKHGISISDKVITTAPLGFFDFVKLEKYAAVVLTDSGTVPEETTIFKVPCIVLRNTTERQELIENGSLILTGTDTDDIIKAYTSIRQMKQDWQVPEDYAKNNVSDTVIRILLGKSTIKRL